MKSMIRYLFIALTIVIISLGCIPNRAVQTPARTLSPTLSVTPDLLTPTPSPHPVQTLTFTPAATLGHQEAHGTLESILEEPEDCDASCFLTIVPGRTSFREARDIFARLDLNLKFTLAEGNRKFYAVVYELSSQLEITVILTIHNDLVENFRLYITPEKQQDGVPRRWSAYSPEALIKRYGMPSKVDFFFGGAAPDPSYAMDLYFEAEHLIVEYYSYDVGPNLQICPLMDQMDSVRIWIGENPVNPPPDGTLLSDATSLTMEEFAQLMTEDPSRACLNLNKTVFQ